MKTIFTYITFTLFGLLVMVNQQAMGQRRQYNGKDRHTTERKRPDYQYDRGYNTAGNNWRDKKNDTYHKKDHYKNHKPSVTVHWRVPDTYRYRRTHWDHHVYHRPPWGYEHRPIMLHHHHGDVYYHHGRFYRYNNLYGYVIIEEPSYLIFTTIPADFHRVYVSGHIYFRFGDIWMVQTPLGYRIWRG